MSVNDTKRPRHLVAQIRSGIPQERSERIAKKSTISRTPAELRRILAQFSRSARFVLFSSSH